MTVSEVESLILEETAILAFHLTKYIFLSQLIQLNQ